VTVRFPATGNGCRVAAVGRNLTHFRFSGHSPIGVIISMVKVLLAGAFPVIFAIYRS
jgi:hypothetical protein